MSSKPVSLKQSYTKTMVNKVLKGLAFDPRGQAARLILQNNTTFTPDYLVRRSIETLDTMVRTGNVSKSVLDEAIQNLVLARIKMEK